MLRLPAEWEAQSFVQLVLPHENTDWSEYLDDSLNCFINIALEIVKREKCILICDNLEKSVNYLHTLREKKNLKIVEIDSNDTWSRDFGAITIFENGEKKLLDFNFNGWGLKYSSNLDNQISKKMAKEKLFGNTELITKDLILEGGSIDSNGNGVILTTKECLLEPNRNPHLTQKEIDSKLKKYFGAKDIIWLEHGYLAGDDTDSHIDTLARFVNENTIVYVKCYDENDEHYDELSKMELELQKTGFNLIPLPLPEPKYYDSERLPATYVNFLIINEAVLVPTYRDKNDDRVLKIFENIFPDREVVGIDCLPLIRQHGSLHCVTMQYH